MTNEMAMVLVAVVTALGGIIVAGIQGLRKENRSDHANVRQHLRALSNIAERTERKVDIVKDELEEHLEWHAERTHGVSGPTESGSDRQ